MRHPDRKQCYDYLYGYPTPEHVVKHCKAVAAVAYMLGKALNAAGGTRASEFKDIVMMQIKKPDDGGRLFYRQNNAMDKHGNPYRPFDLELVLAAGLLHDIARKEDKHWDVGAEFCNKRNLPEEGKIVRVHMQYEFTNDVYHLTEADLVCLGDRLSIEDRYVGLDERMDYIIAKAKRNGHHEAVPRILQKKAETKILLDSIEKHIGCTIDELMADIDYDNTEGIDNDNR